MRDAAAAEPPCDAAASALWLLIAPDRSPAGIPSRSSSCRAAAVPPEAPWPACPLSCPSMNLRISAGSLIDRTSACFCWLIRAVPSCRAGRARLRNRRAPYRPRHARAAATDAFAACSRRPTTGTHGSATQLAHRAAARDCRKRPRPRPHNCTPTAFWLGSYDRLAVYRRRRRGLHLIGRDFRTPIQRTHELHHCRDPRIGVEVIPVVLANQVVVDRDVRRPRIADAQWHGRGDQQQRVRPARGVQARRRRS